jgi:hypothetical protein
MNQFLTPDFLSNYYSPYTKDFDVEVRYISSLMGKGLVAKREFREGDVILIEKPFLVTNIHPTKCDYCFKADNHVRCKNYNLVSSTPCYAQYCSEDCREQAFNQYHALECWATNPKMKKFIEYCNRHDLSNAVAASRAFLHSFLVFLKSDHSHSQGQNNQNVTNKPNNTLDLLVDYKVFHSDDLIRVFPEMDEETQYQYFTGSRELLKEALYDKIDKSLVDSLLTEELWRRMLGMFALNRQVQTIFPFSHLFQITTLLIIILVWVFYLLFSIVWKYLSIGKLC